MKKHTCPCCGFKGLSALAYAELKEDVLVRGFIPPYNRYFGFPSYEVCPCCGYEFGNDDEPGTGEPVAFEQYLEDWITNGSRWFEPNLRPANWNLATQIKLTSALTKPPLT